MKECSVVGSEGGAFGWGRDARSIPRTEMAEVGRLFGEVNKLGPKQRNSLCPILSFFQDVSDPEYAQVQEALKNKLKVSANSNPRPTIYAVAVVEEPSASDKKPKQHARITSKGSLRLAHSAEDVSTLERISRRGKLKTHSIMGCYIGQLCGGAGTSRFVSGFEPCPGTSCCVVGKTLSQCLSPPKYRTG